MKRLFACFLCICLLLWGCGADISPPERTDATTSAPISTENSTQDPTGSGSQPITGSLRSEPLEVTPWDSGRANETSGGGVWETADGYYFIWSQILCYADKSDLGTWVVVCAKPDCQHDATYGECDAIVPLELLLRDGRFYYNTMRGFTVALSEPSLLSNPLVSMALDGTDKRLEYYIPEAEEMSNTDTVISRSVLLSEQFVYSIGALNAEGLYDACVFVVDGDGVYTVYSGTKEEASLSAKSSRQQDIYGDEGFFCSFIEDSFTTVYRTENRELMAVNLDGLPTTGAYLSGNTLRVFRTGDGYYDVDLSTREEVKLSDAQLESSFAHIMLPNCILESTLLDRASLELRGNVQRHELKLFNGEVWLDVALPDELVHASDTTILVPQAVTSDRILLVCRDAADTMFEEPVRIYQILLGTDRPTLEYLGTIG